jgi:hypothetical protein
MHIMLICRHMSHYYSKMYLLRCTHLLPQLPDPPPGGAVHIPAPLQLAKYVVGTRSRWLARLSHVQCLLTYTWNESCISWFSDAAIKPKPGITILTGVGGVR